MRKVIMLMLTMAATLLSVNVFATDMAVFGIELGKPLSVPECEHKTVYGRKVYNGVYNATCVEILTKSISGKSTYIKTIKFGKEESPGYIWGDTLTPTEINGRLEGIQFMTTGTRCQDKVLGELTSKYGKPAQLLKKAVQPFGRSLYEQKFASWNLDGLHVMFWGTIENEQYKGAVIVETPTAQAIREKLIRERESKKKKI